MTLQALGLILLAFSVTVNCKSFRHKNIQDILSERLNLKGPGCGGKPAELFFLLDTSSSIWEPDFHTQLQFVANVTDMFEIGPNHTRVGVATFSSDYHRRFGLSVYDDKAKLRSAILQIPYLGGNTMTGTALRSMRVNEFAPHIVRPNVDKIAIVLTDGRSWEPKVTEIEASLTKEKDINVFAIGIGNKFAYDELLRIGSHPPEKYVFEVASYNALESLKEKLALGDCEVQEPMEMLQGDLPTCHSDALQDVVFVFDSLSMGAAKTTKIQSFIGQTVGEFNFENKAMRAGVVSRNCHHGDIELGDHENNDDFAKDLRNRDFPELSHVLRKMRENSFSLEQGAREMARHMGVIFVDDNLELPKKVFAETQAAHDKGIEVFVVAIGADVNMAEVETMATSPEHVFEIANYDVIQERALDFVDLLCSGEIYTGYDY